MHMIMSFFIKYHKLGTKDASSTFVGICVEGMLYWGAVDHIVVRGKYC